jgi:hypothetical protein
VCPQVEIEIHFHFHLEAALTIKRMNSKEILVVIAALIAATARAQERPSFITYNHDMEEKGSLEVGLNPILGTQRGGGSFLGTWLELEYGLKGWWTTELYLDGEATRGQGSAFTGFRWENRWRPLMLEHRVNPVLYLEYASVTEADKTLREIVGHDVEASHAEPLDHTRHQHQHELEAKLILSSGVKGWNLAHNWIAEKNLAHGAWEFGYAVAATRPFTLAATSRNCSLCAENFAGGVELYGGLGDAGSFGLRHTSHYLAPLVAWTLPGGMTLRLSPTFGLNASSHRFLLRFGIAREVGWGRRGR